MNRTLSRSGDEREHVSVSTRERQATQAERLRAALIAAKLSARSLARLMVEDPADKTAVENRRSQISKWLHPRTDKPGEHGTISDENAARIAAAFRAAGHDYPDDHFAKERGKSTWQEQVAAIARAQDRDRKARQREIRQLRDELADVRRGQEEIIEEIRRLAS